jgi:hypothetical protein
MATYYVRPDGNDTNTGLGSTTGLAWATFGKAFASGSPVVGGDIVYIAPGTYTESITVNATSPASEVRIIGNPTASQFIGVSPGFVRLSSFNAAGTSALFTNTYLISATSKNYYTFENIHFDCNHATNNTGGVMFLTSRYLKFIKCLFTNSSSASLGNTGMLALSAIAATALDATVDRCIFGSTQSQCLVLTGASILNDTSVVKDCLFINGRLLVYTLTLSILNSTVTGADIGIQQVSGSANAYISIQNCLLLANGIGILGTSTSTIQQTYCRFAGNNTNLQNCNTSVTSQTTGNGGVDYGYAYQNGLNPLSMYASYSGSPNTSFGNSTGAPSVDLYDVLWSGSSPDAGASTFKSMTGVSAYLPGSQTASTITIAPASTSQSIELYLGATGLTFATSGLAAYYVRNQSAPVAITLVTQTATGTWASGGFAEIDSSAVPGVYRLDVPNAAFAAGASDVTIVVRGASGTNGAVMTVKLSSGGLTSAQTASAVWGESPAGYATATTFGGVLNETNQVVNSTETIAQDIPGNVWDELRTNHVTAGTFGQYVNAELVTPVTSAALVRMGPFEVKADGLGASDPLDIQTGAQHGIDIQCVDNNGSGIDITSATVTAKVYNSGATLVDTYSCTATYAADGRATFTIDTTVTNVPGTYTATITRTTGASDTQIFGPLRIYVRDI